MKERKKTNRVIFHHSESADVPIDVVRIWHLRRNFSDVGYHKVIRRDGRVENGREEHLIGAHAFGRNGDSIGVCLMGDFARYEPTLEQINAAAGLYHALCRHHGKRLKIEFHRTRWNPCPGKQLDREDFLEVLYRECPYAET